MLLARFDTFVAAITRDSRIASISKTIGVFRFFEGKWFDESGDIAPDSPTLSDLTRTRGVASPWRHKISPTCYFPVSSFDAVVVIDFQYPPRTATQLSTAKLIGECLSHAANAFDATHDTLTGILNKTALELRLSELIDQYSTSVAPIDNASAVEPSKIVAAIALDLDHFKQINDTYGHLYGDIVLKAFASRVASFSASIGRTRNTRLALAFGRTGGEEFVVLVGGEIVEEEVAEIAEALRSTIAETPLPNDAEWNRFRPEADAGTMPLPHLSERRVTVSVGVASVPIATTMNSNRKHVALRLLNEADVALYRAKSGGRNLVRVFKDILTKHGRVIEHHADTDIVAIDIGSTVNVTLGQEFLVFHPLFDGTTPFIFSDGRTKKKIGTYPRQPYARIVAFNVQQEVSFCRVGERPHKNAFPPGSSLEAVPIGAISHLLAVDGRFGSLDVPELTPADELPSLVERLSAAKRWPFVAVFSIANLDGLLRDRGTAYVNSVLAKLHGVLRERMPANCRIGQIQSTQLAVVSEQQAPADALRYATEVLSAATQRCAGLPIFSAGISVRPDREADAPSDKSNLDPAHSLDYARYAASSQMRDGGGITVFSAQVAHSILLSHRRKRDYVQALADYAAMSDIGVRDANVHNIAALCAYEKEQRDLELAIELVKRGIEIQPSAGILHANLGYFVFASGERADAYQHFASAMQKSELSEVYRAPAALSAYSAYREGNDVSRDIVENLLRVASEVAADRRGNLVNRNEVEEALADVLEEHIE